MGSIELGEGSSNARRMSACVAEADYVDSDGVSVSIAINVDQKGHLFELDMWKVDFSPLIQYPNSRTIRNIRCFSVEDSDRG
jgi:hypothetical protein